MTYSLCNDILKVIKVRKVGKVLKMKEEKQTKFIWTTKINEKGQIVIPKEAREVFGYKSGDVLLLFGDKEKGIAISKAEDYAAFAEAVLNKINNEKA